MYRDVSLQIAGSRSVATGIVGDRSTRPGEPLLQVRQRDHGRLVAATASLPDRFGRTQDTDQTLPRLGSCLRRIRQCVAAGFLIQGLRSHVQTIVGPDDRSVCDLDSREPGWIAKRLEDASPLVVAEQDVADRAVLKQKTEQVISDHGDAGHVHKRRDLDHSPNVRREARSL